ncbi:hypothetical protein [Dactylosporangium sp. NPDC048998]|uniref:hypothetical protein n=1 Tax=Dactylosporangium sp. NPDC048998 TaxID=3363976 RepID=UPI0037130351
MSEHVVKGDATPTGNEDPTEWATGLTVHAERERDFSSGGAGAAVEQSGSVVAAVYGGWDSGTTRRLLAWRYGPSP